MNCPICGAINDDGAKVCDNCGADLTASAQGVNLNGAFPSNFATDNGNKADKSNKADKIGKKGVIKLIIGLAALIVVAVIAVGATTAVKRAIGSQDVSASGDKVKIGSKNKEQGIITRYNQLKKKDLEQLYDTCSDELATKAALNAEADITVVSKAELVGYIFVTKPIPNNEEVSQSELTLVYQETVNEYDQDVTYLRAFTFEQLKKLNGEFSFYHDSISDHDYSYPMDCYLDRLNHGSFQTGEATVEADGIFEKYIGCKPIGKLKDLSKESREKLAEDAKSRIENVYVDYNEDTPIFENMNYEGDILVTGETFSFMHNGYYVIYTAEVSSIDGEYGPTRLFIPVGFNDVYKLKNGEFDYSSSMSKLEGIDYRNYFGYESDETMYNELITAIRASAEYELSDSMEYLDEQYKMY